ncbi:hypothetical protein PUR53_47920, partial [Streptomyces sp. SP18BB07]
MASLVYGFIRAAENGWRDGLTIAQAEPERIAGARQQVRELLHDWTCADQVDSAVLLVSEMLTNVL